MFALHEHLRETDSSLIKTGSVIFIFTQNNTCYAKMGCCYIYRLRNNIITCGSAVFYGTLTSSPVKGWQIVNKYRNSFCKLSFFFDENFNFAQCYLCTFKKMIS